eukprot:symbB.v1.2.010588.t1/scaffold686.1/size316167/7
MRELLKDAEHGDQDSVPEVAPILMREKSRRAREGGAADVAKDAYEKVPVEAFGLALLRGMGYDPEKHKTKPIWHEKPRDNLLGLGAQPLLPSEKMALKRPKEEKGSKTEKEQPEKKQKEFLVLAPAIPCYVMAYQVSYHAREAEYLIEMMREDRQKFAKRLRAKFEVASKDVASSKILQDLESGGDIAEME